MLRGVQLYDNVKHGSLKGGNASPLCLHFCYVQRRPRISILSPGYVINFKLRILSIDLAK